MAKDKYSLPWCCSSLGSLLHSETVLRPQSTRGLCCVSQGWPNTTGASGELVTRKVIVSEWLPEVMRVMGTVERLISGSDCPLRALTEILWRSETIGMWRSCAREMSNRLPSAPESNSAVPSCRPAANCNLTGRRVVDEALFRDTPPDSNLRPTVGLDLLLGSLPGNGQPRHSTYTVPSSSDDLSPPGRAGLYPPAWVRQPTRDWPYRQCRGKDILV